MTMSIPQVPVFLDLTKKTMAEFPRFQIVRAQDDAIIAMLPVRGDDERLADGQWTYGAFMLDAINSYKPARTDQEIVDQTNTLARVCLRYIGTGYEVADDFTFHDAEEPRAAKAWELACKIQEIMTKTDPDDALSNLEPEPVDPEINRLLDRRNILMNSYGYGPFADGITRDSIAKIEEELSRRGVRLELMGA